MRRRFELITPHVRRSMLIGKVIDLHRVEAAALADALDELVSGMFIVDSTGRIIHANVNAHRLIAEADVLRANKSRIAAVDPQGNRNLLDVFTAAQAGDVAVGKRCIALPLTGRTGERYVAHVPDLRREAKGRCFLFRNGSCLHPQGGTGSAITAGSGRKPVQADVRGGSGDVRLVQIGGVPEVAPVLGISEQTVKSHLHRIYEKTDTRRQADLVKLVASYAGRP